MTSHDINVDKLRTSTTNCFTLWTPGLLLATHYTIIINAERETEAHLIKNKKTQLQLTQVRHIGHKQQLRNKISMFAVH